jgi:hypothetical protein
MCATAALGDGATLQHGVDDHRDTVLAQPLGRPNARPSALGSSTHPEATRIRICRPLRVGRAPSRNVANIEEQKTDAKLGEQVNRSSRRKKLGANGRHDHAEEEVTVTCRRDSQTGSTLVAIRS